MCHQSSLADRVSNSNGFDLSEIAGPEISRNSAQFRNISRNTRTVA